MRGHSPWVMVPENEAARKAVGRVRACLRSGRRRRAVNPLFIHGPSGSGKSRLVAQLAADLADDGRDVHTLNASEWATVGDEAPSANGEIGADALLIEDVQRLPARAAGALTALLDRALPRQTQVVLTATAGPALLGRLPARLASRLASGLVVGMSLFGVESRRVFLSAVARHRGMDLPAEVLDWLAANLEGSARRLEGALSRLEGVTTAEQAQAALTEDVPRPTVERIAEGVGRYYGVKLSALRGPGRGRGVLLPRQVGMYLARRLTGLPLVSIGAYFGGRDHSTVLHACRKVEEALSGDAPLSLAVRELSAGLS